MSFDTAVYYQLTNSFLGPGQALDVEPDGSGRLRMSPKSNVQGQFWRLVDRGGGKYALRTEYLGDCFSLDVMNNGRMDAPWLAPAGDYAGQSWTLTPWGDGTYKLTNDFTGPGKSLDTTGDAHAPILAPGDFSGQHWTLTPGKKIEGNAAIPDLDSKVVDKSEARTDFDLYARPEGVVRAVMIFVYFQNAEAGAAIPADVARRLLGNGNAQRLLHEQSYGRLTLDVTVAAGLGWRRMKDPTSGYTTHGDFDKHKAYLAEAIGLFAADLDFSEYSLVLVATPEGASLNGASAFSAPPGDGVQLTSGEIRLAATFDGGSLKRYTALVHEVGHLFGLPDLYPDGGGGDNTSTGCWALMSDIFHATSFLGWHRHKNGWLAADRKTYLNRDVKGWTATLHPLSGERGLSMVVLPVDDAVKPSKVFVVELAPPVRGDNGEYWGEGVLLYTVDATIATGHEPVVMIPNSTDASPVFGTLFKAPFMVGDIKTHPQGGTSITLKVVQRIGSSYTITIDYKAP
jgi:M6 family metalloprotease-like protein